MRYLEPVTPPDTLAEAQERVVLRAQRAVLAAQKTIDAAMLESVIDALARSRMIYAFGSGGVSSWMVEELHNRLFRLGLRITSSSDHQMQMMMAATVERGDVVFISSLSGNNAEVIKAARIAADYGATTVALTVRDTPLVKAVALPLTIDFDNLGQKTFVIGADPSQANLVKLLGNMMTATTLETLGEVVAVALKRGLDPKAFIDIMTSTMFGGRAHKIYGDKIVSQSYAAGFVLPLVLKDVRLALAEAESAAAPMPSVDVVRDRLITGIARGYADLDWSALGLIAAQEAGLNIPSPVAPHRSAV
jgi:D-arabinose 5-phosphate isomerase GutQ